MEANFVKDMDAVGKQDPYIQFRYDGRDLKTRVQESAGTKASFTDQFVLDNIENAINEGQDLEIKAFDQDIASSDSLGAANPISLISLVEDEEENILDMALW